MKRFILLAVVLMTGGAYADEYVQGYTKKDGTYVAPHYRSSPDSTSTNNFTAPGNQNPYTGQQSQKSGSSGHSQDYYRKHQTDSGLTSSNSSRR
jgi:hypothetical protein